jgi:hypothetical protein
VFTFGGASGDKEEEIKVQHYNGDNSRQSVSLVDIDTTELRIESTQPIK